MGKSQAENHDIGNEEKYNELYPVFLKLSQLQVLLVGAGNVGLEKLTSLLANSPQANITIVAPQVSAEIIALVKKHPACKIVEKEFEENDLENKQLVILATNNAALHIKIKQLTTVKQILTNVADTPALCDFYLGSIVQKGNLKIAISTNGKSPTMAKRIKELLQDALPQEIDELLQHMLEIRNRLKGDFAYKVKELNQLTKHLSQK